MTQTSGSENDFIDLTLVPTRQTMTARQAVRACFIGVSGTVPFHWGFDVTVVIASLAMTFR